MLLSDNDIMLETLNERLVIDPFESGNIQPASIDIRLDRHFIHWAPGSKTDGIPKEAEVFTIMPQQFILGQTFERIKLPDNIAGRIEGKSSWGRRGLTIHVTAGYIDPGFDGKLTLEICNMSNRPIVLQAGDKIGQISFVYLNTPALRPYGHPDLGSHYQNQSMPQESALDR